jgi:hypothetical protein
MQAKHTPGPLTIRQCAGMISIDSAEGNVLAMIEPWMAGSPQEREANAHLYKAAPDLLAALKVAKQFFINPGSFNPLDVERMYDAAIARAEEV